MDGISGTFEKLANNLVTESPTNGELSQSADQIAQETL
jgi:hypothetical protein